MNYNKLIDKLLLNGQEKMDDLEIYLLRNKDTVISVYKEEINKYSIAESGGLSLRGLSNGKMGYSYTEKIDEASIDMLINEALENGKYMDNVDPEIIFSGSDSYKEVNNFHEQSAEIDNLYKIDFLKKLEKEALSLDDRVFSVDGCAYQEFQQERYIKNTKGVDLYDKTNGAFAYISVVVKEEEDVKTGISFRVFKDLNKIDYKEMAKEAVKEALSMLGAKSIASDNYPIMFKNTTFASLLSAITSIFSADNVQKGLSLLKDKLEEEVASPKLTIIDDPLLEDGFASRAFDDEGTKTQAKKLIDKGKLTSYLYNWKTANKDKVESTGNGNRASYKSSISISPTNLYVEKGDKSFDDVINSIDNGLYITNLAGLHSGLNPISGDFSLSASGYEIIDGKISRPVNQITIASNLFEMFNNVEEIANDLVFGIPRGAYVGSPSIKIKSMSVSGE